MNHRQVIGRYCPGAKDSCTESCRHFLGHDIFIECNKECPVSGDKCIYVVDPDAKGEKETIPNIGGTGLCLSDAPRKK